MNSDFIICHIVWKEGAMISVNLKLETPAIDTYRASGHQVVESKIKWPEHAEPIMPNYVTYEIKYGEFPTVYPEPSFACGWPRCEQKIQYKDVKFSSLEESAYHIGNFIFCPSHEQEVESIVC